MDMKTFLLTVRRMQERPNEHLLVLYDIVTEHMRKTLQAHLNFAPAAHDPATRSTPG